MVRRYGVEPSEQTQLAAARLVRELGIHGAAAAIGIGQNSMARVAVGGQVQQATLVHVDDWLAADPRSPALR